MEMGSWAVSQFMEAGPNPDDMGYMPAPFSYDDRQFAQVGADYLPRHKQGDKRREEGAQQEIHHMVR